MNLASGAWQYPAAPRRPRAFVAATLLLTVLAAGASWLAGPGPAAAQQSDPAPAAEADPLVARVNGHEIRLSAVYDSIEGLSLGDQIDVRDQLERFVDSVVQEEILFQSVLAADFEGDPELRARIKTEVLEYLIETRIAQRLRVDDSAVRHYYDENLELIRHNHVRASQIVLAERAECETLLPRIDSGETFGEIARARSIERESAERGGDIGWFMNAPGPLGFEERLFDMATGEMRVFQSEAGCRLVRLTERQDPPIPPFEEVRDFIRLTLEGRMEAQLLRNLLEEASRAVTVERFELEP